MNYDNFLTHKKQQGSNHGFDPTFVPDYLFDFQKSLVEWAVNKGRSAIFSDCGTGKTIMELVWAYNIVRKTNKNVLILSPLAVSWQTAKEAEKFGIECKVSRDGKINSKITITNYEQLHKFEPSDFVGIVCDESGILKSFKGALRKEITIFMRKIEYRLLATATPAPNDYIELGTSSEALGYLGAMDMLNKFFKNDQHNSKVGRYRGQEVKWRLKGHAELPFWRWICSWAKAMRKPSDLGFDDNGFILPELIINQTVVKSNSLPKGKLFSMPAITLQEQREERRRTIMERCEMVASKVNTGKQALVWCHLNDEGDLLEALIPNSIQVKGSDSVEWKEAAAEWFVGNKCICNDNMFRAKLLAWKREKQILNTIADTIKNIERNDCVNPSNTSEHIKLNENLIYQNITNTTGGNGCGHKNKRMKEIEDDESDMQMTKNFVSLKLKNQKKQEEKTQTLGSNIVLKNMVCPSKNIENLNQKDAQSAEEKKTEIFEDTDSTSITPTILENSEGYCVQDAIKDSESLVTTLNGSKMPPCICGHKTGRRILISKPVMFGYGLNFQCCNYMVLFPSHSYEQYYQVIRRCWRFGQKNPVTVDIITTEGESRIINNLQRKSKQADEMFERLISEMNHVLNINRMEEYSQKIILPNF